MPFKHYTALVCKSKVQQIAHRLSICLCSQKLNQNQILTLSLGWKLISVLINANFNFLEFIKVLED